MKIYSNKRDVKQQERNVLGWKKGNMLREKEKRGTEEKKSREASNKKKKGKKKGKREGAPNWRKKRRKKKRKERLNWKKEEGTELGTGSNF